MKPAPGTLWVDRWYDRPARSWVIQLKDAQGNQIGDAVYVATRAEAKRVSVESMQQRLPAHHPHHKET